jgi:hypothetical protein
MFHSNQNHAIQVSLQNGFASGVHSHATGTGKSWIALQLALEYQKAHPTHNILWICEQKSILLEQFNRAIIKEKGFAELYRRFMIHDYSAEKPADWPSRINSATVWRKPQLVVINRAFLTTGTKYKQLTAPFHLVIHDECHSIQNATTQAFYAHALTTWPELRCIGFSATPCTDIEPYTQTLSHYSIYDAVADGVIVPPHITWLKSPQHFDHHTIASIFRTQSEQLPYKKAVVWCGMIRTARALATDWRVHFPDWMIAMDTCEGPSADFASYEEFAAAPGKALLFCAAKHREGSDIANLDACVFLDRVENRNAKTFVQCVGRVLRRDAGKKTFGLVLDVSAASSIRVCDRINAYLNENSTDSFPFQYDCTSGAGQIEIHTLRMVAKPLAPAAPMSTSAVDLRAHFKRPIPAAPEYITRVQHELDLIYEKQLSHYLMQALEILQITKDVPHVTRGSCGSSLVCYLLGISHVDPIKYGISFARFLNTYRNTLPDIDFDFPYNMRDDVFLQLQLRWPNKIARISNHVHYHEKSALRATARAHGFKLSPGWNVWKLPKAKQAQIQRESKALENTFKTYSLHCGGIVYFADGVPKELRLKTKRSTTLPQIVMDKRQVADAKQFKIDILSSRGLAQLYEARGFKEIQFDSHPYDAATADMLCRGDNIGITLAESPLMRKAILKLQPRSVHDLAVCLAIIRPAARNARVATTAADLEAQYVFDDDAITMIQTTLECDEAHADKFRRGLIKGDAKIQAEFMARLRTVPLSKRTALIENLQNLRAYSFCKSHAYSYAQLVWHLAFEKAHNPQAFWRAALKHTQSSYKRWVYMHAAQTAGVTLSQDCQAHKSIYALNKRANKLAPAIQNDPERMLHAMGYWNGTQFYPGCFANGTTIRGLIASVRSLSRKRGEHKSVVFVGVGSGQFVEVVVKSRNPINFTKRVGLFGRCEKKDDVYECEEGAFGVF